MDLNLKGKVACVAAASKGLGRASAMALAKEGANLVIFSRTESELQETARQIREETGAQVVAVAGDASVAADIERFIAAATAEFGKLDILVVNAGGPPAGSFEKFTDADWQAGFELTVMSAVRMIRAALPALKVQGGSIVAIQSSSVKAPIADLTLSNSLRAAVLGLVKDLAPSLAPDGIRVNLVAPGRIYTDRVKSLDQGRAAKSGITPEEVRRQTEAQIPMRRYGEPEELGRVVAFVASDAASYMTGQTILVDGGMVRSL